MGPGVSIETKRGILARFVDFYVTPTNGLPWQQHVRFEKKSLFVEKFLKKSILANIYLNFTFSTIFFSK